MDPNGTLMGAAQRDWLFDGLAARRRLERARPAGHDGARRPQAGEASSTAWTSGPATSSSAAASSSSCTTGRSPTRSSLAGDIHTNWANDLIADFDGLDGRVVATEFVGTSISSGGDGDAKPKDLDLLLKDNPFVKFHNAERGYLKCEVDAKTFRTDYRTVPFVVKRARR
jgi:alkaline phosphatase D